MIIGKFESHNGSSGTIKEVNEELFRAALQKQVFDCLTKENFKAGIYLHDVPPGVRNKIIEEMVRDMGFAQSGIVKIRSMINELEIIFYNGSSLRSVKGNQSARGNKFHSIIMDTELPEEIKNCVCRPTLIRYILDYDSPMKDDGVDPFSRLFELQLKGVFDE